MTLANLVTLLRLALIPPILALVIYDARWPAFTLFALALLGDVIDGTLARVRHEVTDLGKLLDPLADKLLSAGLLAAFAAIGRLSWLAFALLGFQQLALLAGAVFLARRDQRIIGARPLGKAAAALLALGLALALFAVPGYWVIVYLGITLAYAAGVDYLLKALRA